MVLNSGFQQLQNISSETLGFIGMNLWFGCFKTIFILFQYGLTSKSRKGCDMGRDRVTRRSVPSGTVYIRLQLFLPISNAQRHCLTPWITVIYRFKNIPFIIRNLEFFKKIKILFHKSPFSMVTFLLPDVVNHSVNLRLAVGECSITFLPRKPSVNKPLIVYPFWWISLDILH